MDIFTIAGAIRRRWWLVVLAGVLCAAGAGFAFRPGKLAYESIVRIQLSTPQSDDVSLVNASRSSNVRDEATLARNNFLVVLKSPEVVDRTANTLALGQADADYAVTGTALRDTDFIEVDVRATTPELAQKIANTHVQQAIQRYGELRAKPAGATRSFIAQQIGGADKLTPDVPADPTATSDQARQARDSYDALLKKYSEALLAEESARQASYIQVVSPADMGTPVATPTRIATVLGLAGIGGMGLGAILAVMLQSAATRRVVVESVGRPAYHGSARTVIAALPSWALDGVDADDVLIAGPAVPPEVFEAGPARTEPVIELFPPVLEVVEPQPEPSPIVRRRVRQALVASRYLLGRAAAAPDASTTQVAAAIPTLRGIVDDAWRALRAGGDVEGVAKSFRRNVDGAASLLALTGEMPSAEAMADVAPIVEAALSHERSLRPIGQRSWTTAEAVATVQQLAGAASAPVEQPIFLVAEPMSSAAADHTTWSPAFERAAA